LYLKRLEIVGFKSFADAFELEFQKGITCIVGPNGCGKSNIADSIRWVLGSQSPSELRADRMEDVIFSGTVDRKPQGMAEVVLTFDNNDRELALDFDEVTVTRRLFRSGESEYLLNGNKCRLMDVTDLIVDRGLGSNGYWILEKNMTQTIIESGPADRRFLFDEAAGIVKYKMQRHRAELKLNAVADDLERLDDIIGEVERNVSQLRKQVAAYRRWEKAEKRIREIRGLLDHRVLEESRDKLRNLEERLKHCEAREQKASAAVVAASGRQAEARTELEKAQLRLDEEHARVSQLDGELGRAGQELAVAEERSRNNFSRMEAAQRESAEESGRAERLKADAEELALRQSSLRTRLDEARRALDKASADSEEAEKRYADTASRLDLARKVYEKAQAEHQVIQKEYTDGLRERERAEQEIRHLVSRKAELEEQVSRLEDVIRADREGIDSVRERRSTLEGEAEGSAGALGGIDAMLRDVQARIRELEMEAGVLGSRMESLREAAVHQTGDHLGTRLRVEEGLGVAVGAWLDSFQDAGYCGSVGELPCDGTGERYFLPVRTAERPGMPEGARWLPDLLLEGSDPYLAGLLSRAVLAPDRETALDWFIGGIDLDVVTAGGDLFRSDGLVRLGVPASGGGAIERRALAEAAEKRAAGVASEIAVLEESRNSLSSERAMASSRLEEIRRQISGLDMEEASLGAAMAAREERLGAVRREMESLEEKLPALRVMVSQQDDEGTAGRMEQARRAAEESASGMRLLEERRDALGSKLNGLLRSENSARLEFTSVETSLKQSEEERVRLQEAAEEALRRKEQVKSDLKDLCEERAGLEELIEDLRAGLAGLSRLREEAEGSRTEASRARAEWLEKSREVDEDLMKQREELSAAREERAAVSGELQMVSERCSELGSRELVLPEDDSGYWDYSRERLMSELEKQTGFRENLGPVNMLAVTEYEEGAKRIDFLTGQRKDLDEARASLLGAISDINRTAARKFDQTFVQVRKHFREMFTSLFGGGEAEIMALDSEDPLEGGVQIVAKPPGKKMENIASLSDGERAMTAAALLFALYLVKPSPFCVLDELDAPLDDTNVDNYVNLLKSFVHRTQFVVITHNKRTMEAADRLFGITMAERGVSVMTSVNLEKARILAEGEE